MKLAFIVLLGISLIFGQHNSAQAAEARCLDIIKGKKDKQDRTLDKVASGGFLGSLIISYISFTVGAFPVAPIAGLAATAAVSGYLVVKKLQKKTSNQTF